LGASPLIASTWRHTVTVDTTGADGGQILVGIADGRRGGRGPTVIVTLGFLACVEPFEMQRFQMIADLAGARLAVVETPGFGYARSRLLPDEYRCLRRGDFTAVGRRMLSAVRIAIGEDTDTGPIGLLGYSLGSSTGAALARVANTEVPGPWIDTVVLVEPVALRRWSAGRLVSAMLRENRHVQPYLDETAALDGTVQPQDRRPAEAPTTHRRADLLTLANALRYARLGPDLIASAGNRERPIRRLVVVQGDSSLLSPRQKASRLVSALDDHGVAASIVRAPGHHAFWQSLPRVAELTETVHRLLQGV